MENEKDVCVLCGADGQDKRTLVVDCFYDMTEAASEFAKVPGSFLYHSNGYHMRICKSCRAGFIGAVREWVADSKAKRGLPMDGDGNLECADGHIPVRVDGAVVYMTDEQYAEHRN